MLPEIPDGAKLSLLLQPGLRLPRLPKNLVLRLGDVEPAILSENEAVEYALGRVGLFSPIFEDKILLGRRDDWEYLDGRRVWSAGVTPEVLGGG
jgi:hypothetical protein